MAIVVVGTMVVVAPSVRTMGIVGLQDAARIEGLESTPHLMVEDQGGSTRDRLLTPPLMAAQIGGILLVALGEV